MTGDLDTPEFLIHNRRIGPGNPVFVIAEVGQNHDGSLGAAHAYIDAVSRTGADAVKFQTHIAHAESTRDEPFRVKFSKQDATRYEYWQRMEFTEEQWAGLAKHASDMGLLFLSSPFSLEAVELLERIGMVAWKVGSGEVTNKPFLERLASSGKPVLLSSGMSTWAELDDAVETIQRSGSACSVFQCTTEYPCPPEHLGLNLLDELRNRYHCPVGLSDHSASVYAGLAAVALTADLIEVHVTLSRDCFGPDIPASVTVDQLSELVEGSRFIQKAVRSVVDKDAVAQEKQDLRTMFGRSLVATRHLEEGATVKRSDVGFKKPGGGMAPDQLADVVGKVLCRALPEDERFQEDDLE